MKLFCDNQSTNNLAKSNGYRPRSKLTYGITIFITEKIDNGFIYIEYISTTETNN